MAAPITIRSADGSTRIVPAGYFRPKRKTKRRRPVDRASWAVARSRHAALDEQFDERVGRER